MGLRARHVIAPVLLFAALGANVVALIALSENAQGEFCTPEGVDTGYLAMAWCLWFGAFSVSLGGLVAVAAGLRWAIGRAARG